MSLDRRSRKILLWISRGINAIAVTMGVYIVLDWDIATIEDGVILIVLMAAGAITKSFSL